MYETLGTWVKFGTNLAYNSAVYVLTSYFRNQRQNKLNSLKKVWFTLPKGTLVIATEPFYVCRTSPGRSTYQVPGSFDKTHLIYTDQGAMLMEIMWPEVKDFAGEENFLRFVFWCNDGYYEWATSLDNFCQLPFRVLD